MFRNVEMAIGFNNLIKAAFSDTWFVVAISCTVIFGLYKNVRERRLSK